MNDDYYKALGVSRSASQEEIQKAYRSAARKFHPDLNPDDKSAKEKFQKIQQAYDVLGDPEKREKYDRFGAGFENMGPGPGGGGPHSYTWTNTGGGASGAPPDFDFNDLFGGGGGAGVFDSIFGGGGGRRARPGAGARPRQHPKGADLRRELHVPFNTAVLGGKAQVSAPQESGNVETIELKIPAGVEDGKLMRLRGKGQRSPLGGEPGDLLVTIRVSPHPCFRRSGANLEVTLPITLSEAAAGGKVDLPTPQGAITLTIPAGATSGQRLRVRGRGAPGKDGRHGDLFAVLQVTMPPDLDDDAKEKLRDIEAAHPYNPRDDLRW